MVVVGVRVGVGAGVVRVGVEVGVKVGSDLESVLQSESGSVSWCELVSRSGSESEAKSGSGGVVVGSKVRFGVGVMVEVDKVGIDLGSWWELVSVSGSGSKLESKSG